MINFENETGRSKEVIRTILLPVSTRCPAWQLLQLTKIKFVIQTKFWSDNNFNLFIWLNLQRKILFFVANN